VLNHAEGVEAKDADAKATLTRDTLNKIVLKETSLKDALASGDIKIGWGARQAGGAGVLHGQLRLLVQHRDAVTQSLHVAGSSAINPSFLEDGSEQTLPSFRQLLSLSQLHSQSTRTEQYEISHMDIGLSGIGRMRDSNHERVAPSSTSQGFAFKKSG
jgi:hypothetical protein